MGGAVMGDQGHRRGQHLPEGQASDADLVDTTSQALGWLRDRDLLKRDDEAARDYEEAQKFRPRPKEMAAHYEGRT